MRNEKPASERIAYFMSMHERGVSNRLELSNQILSCVLAPGFFECLPGLPADLQEDARRGSENPAAHPWDVPFATTAHFRFMTDEEWAEMLRRWRIGGYWASKALFDHFHPGEPFPTFEPIKSIGIATGATQIDGEVALFGEFNDWIIHDHPIHVAPPAGPRIVTRCTGLRFVSTPFDPAGRHFGFHALFLGPEVRSPSQVPPGTEVFVDRTAADMEIPPL